MPLWKFRFNRRFEQLRRYRHVMPVLMKYGFEEVATIYDWRVANSKLGFGFFHTDLHPGNSASAM